MIFKLLGTLLLLGAGGYISLALNRFERRRLAVLDGYISLLRYIKGQIECYAMPLPDILARADPGMIAACLGVDPTAFAEAAFAEAALAEAAREEITPLPALVRESRLYLEPESERLLTALSGELGAGFRAEQVARCDYYLEALVGQRSKLADALPARLRVGSTICMCCAVAATILLW